MLLLHTADWQFGMEAAHAGAAAGRVRAARRTSAGRAMELARERSVDAVLVAGDTFEDHAVSLEEVEAAAALLGSVGCPVFILPGNHDPWTAGSVWQHPAWARLPNVRILHEAQPVELAGATLYPCPLKQKWGGADPTAWIPEGPREGLRIGLAHGTQAGMPDEATGFPIPPDAAERHALDYLALGHWHSTRIYGRMAYSGTHETTSFGEDSSGNVLLVDVHSGSLPTIETIRTGRLRWHALKQEIRQAGELAAVVRQVEAWASPEALLDLRLSGILFEEDAESLAALQALSFRFLHMRLDTAALCEPAALEDLAEGPLKETARRLELMGSDAARLALRQLLRLARGGEA